MSIYNHTPGPWLACHDGDDSDKIEVCVEVPDGLTWICADVATVADAQLIAAAPEMLDVLLTLKDHCERTPDLNGTILHTIIKTVIEKAIGTTESLGDDPHNARNLADQEEGNVKIICGTTLGDIDPAYANALSKAIPTQHAQQKGGSNE